MIYILIWLLALIVIIGGLANRALTRRDALLIVRPDLADLREVVVAAHLQANNAHTKDKLSYAVVVLDELTDAQRSQ